MSEADETQAPGAQVQTADPAKKRKVFIVIEETGLGNQFKVLMGGDIERIGKIPDADLSPAEFWGNTVFGTAVNLLRNAGVIGTPQENLKKKSIIEV